MFTASLSQQSVHAQYCKVRIIGLLATSCLLTCDILAQREEDASQYSEIGTPTWSAIADEPMDYSQRGPFGDALPRQEAPEPRRVSASIMLAICFLNEVQPHCLLPANMFVFDNCSLGEQTLEVVGHLGLVMLLSKPCGNTLLPKTVTTVLDDMYDAAHELLHHSCCSMLQSKALTAKYCHGVCNSSNSKQRTLKCLIYCFVPAGK